MPAPGLTSRWLDRHRPHWERLEALVARGQRGTASFTHQELRELALLYRQTAADLAASREHSGGAQLTAYLNRLLGTAHNLIYRAEPARLRAVVHFFARGVPRVFRATWRYTAAATALFGLGSAAGLALALTDPGFERFVLGGAMVDTIARGEMWTHSILAVKPLASSEIMTNNLSVAFTAFAAGLTVIGTAYVLAFNGLLLGVIGTACQRAGLGLSLWSFVAPHGALELPAIVMAGGAGLLLARGLLVPGALPRRESLNEAAANATRLVLGVIPLLIVAGLIEGFVSPVPLPPALKLLIGGSIFVLLAAYLLSGRSSDAHNSPRDLTSR